MAGLILSLAFLAGVLLHDSGVGLVSALPIGMAAGLATFLVPTRADRTVIGFAVILACLGAWIAQSDTGSHPDIVIELTANGRSIDATVIGVPTTSTVRTLVNIRLNTATNQTIKASLPPFPVVVDGDVIRFWAPHTWDNPRPGEVTLPISQGDGRLFIASFVVTESHPSFAAKNRTTIDSFLKRAIDRNVPEPAGSLTLGILNGDDTGMTDATRSAFRSAGMSHITAVSGWNVAIVAALIALILRRFSPGRWITVIAGLAVVWSYAFLVGMEPSVVRAGGMATIFLLAHWRGRPGDLLTSLLMTTAVIVAVTPGIRFDIGFQLSVAATLGIVLLLETDWSRPWWQSALAVPFVAELAVAPLLLHHLGTYSLLSPISNLLTAPLVELVMGGGIATIVGSAIHPFLGEIAGAFTWVPARMIVAIAEFSSSLSWASSTTMTMSWSLTFLTYLTLILGYLGWKRIVPYRRVSSVNPIVRDSV